ncbi:MAG: hypothetical protein IPM64_02375 [Phycisphaerales bacterium]|nr:hypothetical protein [Phycisphaerales bacterium]
MSPWMNDLIAGMQQVVPADAQSLYLMTAGAVGVGGVLMLLYGARWMRGLTAVGGAGAGASLGLTAAAILGVPPWITSAFGGIVGLVFGIAGHRLVVGLLIGAILASIGSATYAQQSLAPHLAAVHSDWSAGSLTNGRPVGWDTLPAAFNALTARVPNVGMILAVIAGLSLIAGYLLSQFLPRLSASVCAATAGTAAVGASAVILLGAFSPQTVDQLVALGAWGWAIFAVIWLAGFFRNLRPARKAPLLDDEDGDARRAPRMA